MLVASQTLSSHLILGRPLLLLPSHFPNIKVFSRESSLLMRWPKYWSLSFRICPSSGHSGLISFRVDRFVLLAILGTLIEGYNLGLGFTQHHLNDFWQDCFSTSREQNKKRNGRQRLWILAKMLWHWQVKRNRHVEDGVGIKTWRNSCIVSGYSKISLHCWRNMWTQWLRVPWVGFDFSSNYNHSWSGIIWSQQFTPWYLSG